MYHIWTAQCQIQLCAGKRVNHQDSGRISGRIALQGGGKLASAVTRAICSMNESKEVLAAGRDLHLRKTGQDLARLADDSQCIKGGALDHPLGLRCQVGGYPHVPLEPASEHITRDGIFECNAGRGYPDAATWQLAFDVWHRFSIRAYHEADHFSRRSELAGKRAHAFRSRGDVRRPAI